MPNRIELSPNWVVGVNSMAHRLSRASPTGLSDAANIKTSAGLLFVNPSYPAVSTNDLTDSVYTPGFGGSTLTIMKGSRPTSISQISPTMKGTEVNSRLTDALLVYESASGHFSPAQLAVNPVIFSTIFVPARLTGTATWFWLRNYGGSGIPYGGPGIFIGQSVIGTVGLLGSGADLEMADVNVLSGDNYRISAMKLEFPTSWEF